MFDLELHLCQTKQDLFRETFALFCKLPIVETSKEDSSIGLLLVHLESRFSGTWIRNSIYFIEIELSNIAKYY